jgi:DNA-binding transcriptional LysR family regulator
VRREELVDLSAFLTVAEEESFTRAAAKLGTSQSSLSRTIRRLEDRLGVQLLTRTTRRVAATEAGGRLIGTLKPALDSILAELTSLGELREKPAGTIRITASEHAADSILWPALERLLPEYPDINIELSIDPGLTDIVEQRFDAGVRLGQAIAKDMVALRIGPDMRMAVIGAPRYFEKHKPPYSPQDLAEHACINLRLPSAGGFYAWQFEKGGQDVRVRVDGQLAFNDVTMIVRAATAGFGLAHVMEDRVRAQLADGRLVRVLEDWCPPVPGYHLYYPSRRQHSAAFSLLLERLRYRN